MKTSERISKILSPSEYSQWDQFVEAHKNGSLFHTTRWMKCFNQPIHLQAVFEADKIIGGVCLLKSNRYLIKGYHLPPYTQYIGPLVAKDITDQFEVYNLLLRELKAGHIDFRMNQNEVDPLFMLWNGYSSSIGITYIVKGRKEDYLSSLHPNKRRELKKLLKMESENELSVIQNGDKKDILDLLEYTGRSKKFNIHRTHVESILSISDKEVLTLSLYHSKEGLVSAGVFPFDNHTVYNIVNASKSVNHKVLKTANLLLLYRAIEFALDSGRRFDFEGSSIPGVSRFYRLMGGKQKTYYRFQKSPSLWFSFLRFINQLKNER